MQSSSKPVVLLTEPDRFSPKAMEKLDNFSQLLIGPFVRSAILKNIENANIIMVRLGHKIDRELIDAAKNLRMIASPTTGLDHIDIDYANGRSIDILSLQGQTELLSGIHATAEHCWALLLNLSRHISPSFDHVRQAGWDRDLFWGVDLAGKKLGIIGFGRLGRRVAHYANAFEMKIITAEPNPVDLPGYVELTDLPGLLESSDFISIHVPLNNNTRGLIGNAELAKVKKGACIINTSRGGILNDEALIKHLDSGHLKGAALDVIDGEEKKQKDWLKKNKLIEYAKSHQNLLITPHIGGATIESIHKTEEFIVEKMIEHWNS